MVNKIHDIETPDDNKGKKITLFSFITLLIIGSSIYYILIPAISDYLRQDEINRVSITEIMEKEKKYSELSEEVDRVYMENDKVIEAFNQIFSVNDFLEFCDQYFHESTLTKVDLDTFTGEYIIYQFHTSMKVENPKNFYSFLEGLSTYKNIIQIEYPIKMEGSGNFIKISFKIKVYKLDENRERAINKFDDEE